ncbi:hypothetical protein DHEL01_v201880 [Diaporthe helianthi]|uniref:Uncharacterized protein n=1 Tax=Diaporthe helianthi TaxID=158607 RepID=A0A2P5IB23_DIAHE|nr:hypothetical protein DHEL01_v201880 [Diaporthe helianthi]
MDSSKKALIGVPGSSNGDLFHEWAQLPISRTQWAHESKEHEHKRLLFRDCEPLPGAEKILSDLSRAYSSCSGDKVELALASTTSNTSSNAYDLKTSRPETARLLRFFQPHRRVLGDDPRLRKGRGKPAPDIYLLALDLLNTARDVSKSPIIADECLVF